MRMASEDTPHSSGRLSSLSVASVYEDPPVTDPGVINQQLGLEIQLKNHIEELIRAYLNSDSLDKVEELTENQLSCCGRISALRLQLLRLRRSSTSIEDLNITVENPLEKPLDILDMMASEEDTPVVAPDNGKDTIATSVTTDLVLKEAAEALVNNVIKNSVAQLSDQIDVLPAASQQSDAADQHEKVINEVETDIENKSINNRVASKDVSNETLNDYCVAAAAKAVVYEFTSPPVQSDIDSEQTSQVTPDADPNQAHPASSSNVELSPVTEHLQPSLEDQPNQAVEDTTRLSDKLEEEPVKNEQVDKDSDSLTEGQTVEESANTSVDQQPTKDNQATEVTTDQPIANNLATNSNESMDLSAGLEVTENDQATKEIEPPLSQDQSITASPVDIDDSNISEDIGQPAENQKFKEDETITVSEDTRDSAANRSCTDQAIVEKEGTKENVDLPAATRDEQASEETKSSTKNQPINGGTAATTENVSSESTEDQKVSEDIKPSAEDQSINGDKANKDLSTTAMDEHETEDQLVPLTKNPCNKACASSQIACNDDAHPIAISDSHCVLPQSVEPTSTSQLTKQRSSTLDSRKGGGINFFSKGKKMKSLPRNDSGAASVTRLGALSTFEWDPSCLIEELYIDCKPIAPPGTQPSRLVVTMEKLPRNQEKKTIAKGWKKRYFCVTSGNMYYYDEQKMTKALGVVKLSGAKVSCQNQIIRVTDKMNQTIVIRGKPEDSYHMYRSLQLESVHPTLTSILNPYPGDGHPVVIVDIGSCSVRAGFASGDSYPHLFFPAVCSVVKDTDEIQACGMDALLPSTRQNCEIVFPTRAKLRMDQGEMAITLRYIHCFLLHIFTKLRVEPSSAKVLMTLPQNYSEQDKDMLIELLLENLSCEAVSLQEQHILSLYSYGATTGIIVDIGDRTDIVPIVDGFKIDSGATKLQVGGGTVTDSLRRLSTEYGLRYFSEVEFYVMRLVKEKLGFVSQDFAVDMEQSMVDASSYTRALEVDHYQLPDRKTVIAMSSPLFRAFEGFFQPSIWGKDIPSIPQSILKAIQSCDVDRRREIARSIFLSGGATLTTGFQERLEQELTSISPSSYNIQIQASVSRHHAAFLGAAVLASLDSFQDSWITKEQFAISKT